MPIFARLIVLPALCLLLMTTAADAQKSTDRAAFESLLSGQWSESFADDCTDDWHDQWFLDGEKAIVTNSAEAMTIDTANGYAVLWTKKEFKGDLRIEYDFKRVDSNNKGVNIIYIQAVGDGQDGHVDDITQWSDRRTTAAMKNYYLNMHTYHISYAAYPDDYIRGRRYLPLENKGLAGTELAGEYNKVGVFDDHEWVRVTIVKTAEEFYIEFRHPQETLLCHFVNEDKPPIERGRVGLRLMPGRMSQFRNIRISERAATK